MRIIYKDNPLHSIVELDDNDKKELSYKIKLNFLEENIDLAFFYLNNNRVDQAKRILYYLQNNDTNHAKTFEYVLDSLSDSHSGDCVCIASSCIKCWAESFLEISTIEGLGKHMAYKIYEAFGGYNNDKTIDEALEYLNDYKISIDNPNEWESLGGYQQYIPRWKQEAKDAYEWLLKYKHQKLEIN